jgi:hypothetical protein
MEFRASSPAQSLALFLFALLSVTAATMDKVAAAGCIVAEWGCILDTTSEGMGCRTKALEVDKANADHATRTDAFFPILESLVWIKMNVCAVRRRRSQLLFLCISSLSS